MSKEKAHTAHGVVEYETVECDSCGNETLPDNTEPFTLGDKEGVACDMCYENGPVGFPEKAREWTLPDSPNDVFLGVVLVAPMALPIIITGVLGNHYEQKSEYMNGVATGVFSVALWVLILLSVWILLA